MKISDFSVLSFILLDLLDNVRLHHIVGVVLFLWASWQQNKVAKQFAKLRQNKTGMDKSMSTLFLYCI